MNSLFKKFLFYNIAGLIILSVLSVIIIFLSNNYQLQKRLSLLQNQSLITYNYINSSNFIRNLEGNYLSEELNANIELRNVSIIILNSNKKIIFDSKGYDIETKSFSNEEYIQLDEIKKNEKQYLENSSIKRDFINNSSFSKFMEKSLSEGPQKFFINTNDKKILLFSIFPFKSIDQEFFIIAYENNEEIVNINRQIMINVSLSVMAIITSLLTFSIFLNYVILKPIKSLARSASNIEKNLKSKPKIDELGKRKDEIGDLSNILNEMLDNLYEKINDAEKYSADLMHEIRNPLASVKMATEVISDDLNFDQKKFILMIQGDVTRIENIITDYSAMIKNESKLSKTEPQIFNFNNLILRIINDYKKINIDKINFKFITNYNLSNSVTIKGQESFIEQSIKNIIDNAISFSCPKDFITINLSTTLNYLSLSISDQGPGIKEPIVEKIFDRFYSLRENNEHAKDIHSGLGLNIAKQIIDTHDGYISANNVLENDIIKGARFIINLPIHR